MKALLSVRPGGPGTLELTDVPTPQPGKGELRVGVPNGGLAEKLIVPAQAAIRLPKDANPIEGAALIFTYGTTIHALVDRGQLKAGETLLILGAAGGIGLSAI